MAKITKTERLLNLVSYLLKERFPVPWRNIAGRVVGYDDGSDPKSLERRFERDKAALKDMGIPIRYFPPGIYDSDGYMVPREACFLDEVDLLPHETALLNLVTENAVRHRSDYAPELLSALRKLSFDVERAQMPAPKHRKRGRPPQSVCDEADDEVGTETGGWKAALLRLELSAGMRGDPNLPVLTSAVLANQSVVFSYYTLSRDETRERTIDAYGLGYGRGAWYVVGRDHWRNKVQCFNLLRIRGEARPVGEPRSFKVPSTFMLREHIDRPTWEMSDEPACEVVIEVDDHLAWFLQGPIAKKRYTQHADGSAEIAFDVRNTEAFLAWLMPKLRHVRIKEPADLRAQLIVALDRLVGAHAGQQPVAAMGES